MRRSFIRASRAYFSTQENKNVFVLPKKHEIRAQILTEVQTNIIRSRSCSIIAATLKQNIQWYIDEHIRIMYEHMRSYKLDADDSFHTVIAPITLEYIKCFNRQQSLVFFEILMYMIELNVDNPQLQSAILQKLDEQNIYRYIPLYESSQLLNKLLDHEKLRTHSLTKKLIGVVYQQKKFYQHYAQSRKQLNGIIQKLENYQGSDPQLTEAYKQLV